MLSGRLYMDSVYSDARFTAKYLKNGFKILDFGTGSGIFAIILSQLINGVEIQAIDTKNNKSQRDPNFSDTLIQQKLIWEKFHKTFGINFSHFNDREIPFPDKHFDLITAYAVIEHVEPPEELNGVLTELKRVLKDNGLLFIFKTPRRLAYLEYLSAALGFPKHNVLFGDTEIKLLFKKHGLSIVQSWKSNLIPEYPPRITNRLYPLLRRLTPLLDRSPFSILAHHNNFVLKKDNFFFSEKIFDLFQI